MIIDDHVHIGTLNQYGPLAEDFMRPGRLGGTPTWWDPTRTWRKEDIPRTAEQVVSDMDKYGIDKSCLLPFVATPRNCNNASERLAYLDWVAGEVQKYPDRLIGFASVDPVGGLKAVREIDYAIDKLDFKGLKLAIAYNLVKLDDRRIWPVWERAEELDIPVLVHTGTAWADCPLNWQNPLLLDDIGHAFPKLKLIICHVGYGSPPEHSCTLARKHPNFHLEVSGLPRLGMDHMIRVIQLIKSMTISEGMSLFDKVTYGTDYPWRSPSYADLLKKLPKITKERGMDPHITDEDMKKLLGENMARLLKL